VNTIRMSNYLTNLSKLYQLISTAYIINIQLIYTYNWYPAHSSSSSYTNTPFKMKGTNLWHSSWKEDVWKDSNQELWWTNQQVDIVEVTCKVRITPWILSVWGDNQFRYAWFIHDIHDWQQYVVQPKYHKREEQREDVIYEYHEVS
jgi:hypothetical protein